MAAGALDDDRGDDDLQDEDAVVEVDIRENHEDEDSQSSDRSRTTHSDDSSVEQSHDVSPDTSLSDRERNGGRHSNKRQVIDR